MFSTSVPNSRLLGANVSRLYLTSLDVIGWPSDHFWFANSLNVTVFLSGATCQLCAMPGTGPRALVLKSASSRQLIDQTTKSSSSSSMNGFSVWGSCPQPMRKTFLPSWAPAGAAASANASAAPTASAQSLLMCARIAASRVSGQPGFAPVDIAARGLLHFGHALDRALHVLRRRARVDGAEAQHDPSADDRGARQGVAVARHRPDDARLPRVVAVAPEAHDRELGGARDLPAGRRTQERLAVLGQRDPAAHRLAERGQAEDADRQPQLQRARPARELHRAVAEVDLAAHHIAQVVALQRERPLEQPGLPPEQAADLIGLKEPLVRVEHERIGALEAGEQRPGGRPERRGRAVGAVHVQPEVLLGAQVGQRVQRVD